LERSFSLVNLPITFLRFVQYRNRVTSSHVFISKASLFFSFVEDVFVVHFSTAKYTFKLRTVNTEYRPCSLFIINVREFFSEDLWGRDGKTVDHKITIVVFLNYKG